MEAGELNLGSIVNLKHLTREENILLNKVAREIREPFNNLIAQLYEGKEEDIDWLVSSVASRNIYMSPLYLNCCYLGLIKKLIETDQLPESIVVGSKALKTLLDEFFFHNRLLVSVVYQTPLIEKIKNPVLPLLRWFKQCIHFPYQYLKLRKTCKRDYHLTEAITLLDVFILDNSFIEGNYYDRYYTGLLEFLTDEEKKHIYYIPTFHNIASYNNIIKGLNSSNTQFLLKEDFLLPEDYWFALGHYWRMLRFKIDSCSFLGFEIRPLIEEEIHTCSSNGASITALLNYQFAQRLNQRNISIKLIVDWFENQVIDRGLVAGFREFFPQTEIVGYVGGPYPDNNIHLIPTTEENKSKVIPAQIAVMGKEMIAQTRLFCPDLKVSVAPAFRFQHVWEEKSTYPNNNQFTVLVALPIILKDGNEILHLLSKVLDKAHYQFNIKAHPTNNPEKIKKYYGDNWPNKFQFITGDFNTCVETSDLLISNGSSTCLETLGRGIPVIIIGSQSELTQNPIPLTLTEDIWALCYTEEELIAAIIYYAGRDPETIERHRQVGNTIRESYFEPVTGEGAREFLRVTN